jgi:hypothetical protein
MNRRETRTTKTIRENFYGLMLMVGTNKNDKLQCLFMMVSLMGDGATSEHIFRLIYYMLNNVVNLVKYGFFILLVVVMFF